jgi:hypothetical protein
MLILIKLDVSQIKFIELCYENCEVFLIKPHFIHYILVSNEKMKYNTRDFPKRYKNATNIEFSISSDADQIGGLWMEEERNPFERTQCFDDIVYIDIEYINGAKEAIYVPWDGTDYTNYNQSSEIDQDGNLIVVIKKDA